MKSLQCHPKNLQVLCNAACLVANLATSEQDQVSIDAVLVFWKTFEDVIPFGERERWTCRRGEGVPSYYFCVNLCYIGLLYIKYKTLTLAVNACFSQNHLYQYEFKSFSWVETAAWPCNHTSSRFAAPVVPWLSCIVLNYDHTEISICQPMSEHFCIRAHVTKPLLKMSFVYSISFWG